MSYNPVIIKQIKIAMGSRSGLFDEAIVVFIDNEEMFQSTDLDEDELKSFLHSIHQPFKVLRADGSIAETYNCD
jgi:hypothetical protein